MQAFKTVLFAASSSLKKKVEHSGKRWTESRAMCLEAVLSPGVVVPRLCLADGTSPCGIGPRFENAALVQRLPRRHEGQSFLGSRRTGDSFGAAFPSARPGTRRRACWRFDPASLRLPAPCPRVRGLGDDRAPGPSSVCRHWGARDSAQALARGHSATRIYCVSLLLLLFLRD